MADCCIKHIRRKDYDYVRVSSVNSHVLDAIETELSRVHQCTVEQLRKQYVKRTRRQLIIHDVMDLDDFTLVVGNIYDALKNIPLNQRKSS